MKHIRIRNPKGFELDIPENQINDALSRGCVIIDNPQGVRVKTDSPGAMIFDQRLLYLEKLVKELEDLHQQYNTKCEIFQVELELLKKQAQDESFFNIAESRKTIIGNDSIEELPDYNLDDFDEIEFAKKIKSPKAKEMKYIKQQLESKSFNELKKIAKEEGLNCFRQKKEDLILKLSFIAEE